MSKTLLAVNLLLISALAGVAFWASKYVWDNTLTEAP